MLEIINSYGFSNEIDLFCCVESQHMNANERSDIQHTLQILATNTTGNALNITGGTGAAAINVIPGSGQPILVGGGVNIIDNAGHLVPGGTAPTYTAGSGAGTGPTIAISGNDNAGAIFITTGTGPSASATVVTVIYNATWSVTPTVILTPANATTAALSGNAQVWVSSTSTSQFVINVGSTNLIGSTAYKWYYMCIA